MRNRWSHEAHFTISLLFLSLSARILCLSGSPTNISFPVITTAGLQGLLWSSSRTECLLVKTTELIALSVTLSIRVNSLFPAQIFSTITFRLSYKNTEEQWMVEWVPFLVQHWPINLREEHLWPKQCIIPVWERYWWMKLSDSTSSGWSGQRFQYSEFSGRIGSVQWPRRSYQFPVCCHMLWATVYFSQCLHFFTIHCTDPILYNKSIRMNEDIKTMK